jgi:hypothetical protein
MYLHRCAAMWEWPPDSTMKVKYLEHMGRVKPGDLIFMFASGLGVIGVGSAKDCRLGPLFPGDYRRIRGDDYRGAEWQVPVEWLHWQPEDPCPFKGWNGTFYELANPAWEDRRAAVLRFFGC